ncbi:MAG: hypothetical protein VW239_08040, partial [Candidatus Nanopelagicales bacterium]
MLGCDVLTPPTSLDSFGPHAAPFIAGAALKTKCTNNKGCRCICGQQGHLGAGGLLGTKACARYDSG